MCCLLVLVLVLVLALAPPRVVVASVEEPLTVLFALDISSDEVCLLTETMTATLSFNLDARSGIGMIGSAYNLFVFEGHTNRPPLVQRDLLDLRRTKVTRDVIDFDCDRDRSDEGAACYRRVRPGARPDEIVFAEPVAKRPDIDVPIDTLRELLFIHPQLNDECVGRWKDDQTLSIRPCGSILAKAFDAGDVWLRRSVLEWPMRFDTPGTYEIRLCNVENGECASVRKAFRVVDCDANETTTTTTTTSSVATAVLLLCATTLGIYFYLRPKKTKKKTITTTTTTKKKTTTTAGSLSPAQRKIVDREIESYPADLRRLFSEEAEEKEKDEELAQKMRRALESKGFTLGDISSGAVAKRLETALDASGFSLGPEPKDRLIALSSVDFQKEVEPLLVPDSPTARSPLRGESSKK